MRPRSLRMSRAKPPEASREWARPLLCAGATGATVRTARTGNPSHRTRAMCRPGRIALLCYAMRRGAALRAPASVLARCRAPVTRSVEARACRALPASAASSSARGTSRCATASRSCSTRPRPTRTSPQRLRAADALCARTDLRLPVETHARPTIWARASSCGAKWSRARRIGCASSADHAALASGAAGLRYAVETLIQLVDARGALPACLVDDAPDFREARDHARRLARQGADAARRCSRWSISACGSSSTC